MRDPHVASIGCGTFLIFFLFIILVKLLILGAIGFLIGTLIMGNFWFSEDDLVRAAEKRNIAGEVVDFKRGFYNYGTVTFKNNEEEVAYLVDSNIFWDVTLIEQ